ncbi:hypothetical protein H8I91_19015 [Serratia fonticola]|nr:hypothetical protein [Serratia fonticola]
MTINPSSIHIWQYSLYRNVLKTLRNLTPRQSEDQVIMWATTRQIADANNISIYKARQLLLGLVKLGLVIVSDAPGKNSLRWYPLDSP